MDMAILVNLPLLSIERGVEGRGRRRYCILIFLPALHESFPHCLPFAKKRRCLYSKGFLLSLGTSKSKGLSWKSSKGAMASKIIGKHATTTKCYHLIISLTQYWNVTVFWSGLNAVFLKLSINSITGIALSICGVALRCRKGKFFLKKILDCAFTWNVPNFW